VINDLPEEDNLPKVAPCPICLDPRPKFQVISWRCTSCDYEWFEESQHTFIDRGDRHEFKTNR
jgi:hypothetical protein